MESPREYITDTNNAISAWDHEINGIDDIREVSGMGDEIARGHYGVLVAPGVSSCLAIAVHDKTNDTGYMGHFTTPDKDIGEFAESLMRFDFMLEQDGVDTTNCDAIVAGLEYEDESSGNFLAEPDEVNNIANTGGKRALAQKYIEDTFNGEALWDNEPGYAGELKLDLNSGQITYDKASIRMR